MLDIQNLKIYLHRNSNKELLVDLPELTVKRGEVLGLLGESGSGKSLTSLAIMGLLPDSLKLSLDSKISFDGVDISDYSEKQLQDFRGKKIAMIFQEPMTALNPVMKIGQQVAEVLIAHKICPKFEVQARVVELFQQVELPRASELYNTYPHQLSGGMKQRVMIAMALAGEPELLIADEPTSALDVMVQFEIIGLLKRLQKKRNLSILFITHDVTMLKDFADSIAVFYAGSLMELGSAHTILSAPLHPYTFGLMQCLPDFEKRDHFMAVIPGHYNAQSIHAKQQCKFIERCQWSNDKCHQHIPLKTVAENHFAACILYNGQEATPKFKTSQQEPLLKTIHGSQEKFFQVQHAKIYFPRDRKWLRKSTKFVRAVDDVSFDVKQGKTTAIIGESGCGKTTLVKGLLGLVQPFSGEIFWKGHKVKRRDRQFKKNIQLVFQDPFSSLNPRMLVGDIIAEGMNALSIGGNKHQKITDLIQQMQLPKDSIHRYPHEFSGGQRQRICIARALAVEPELLILDEPTSALDVSVQAQIINLLKQLQINNNLTFLFITHDMNLVSYFADEVLVMKKGQIVERGSVHDIIKNPKESYTETL